MGDCSLRAKRAGIGESRRQQLLASAAVVLALSLAAEARAGDSGEWLIRDFGFQAGRDSSTDILGQEATRPDWEGEPTRITNEEAREGLSGRARAGLHSWRGQLILQKRG